jgi:predicted DNA-binding protein (UPF0251 family)
MALHIRFRSLTKWSDHGIMNKFSKHEKNFMARKPKPPDASELDLSLAIRAAWLSYIGGRTQGQIAERLNISQAKVHRLIAEALKQGLVKVFVQGEPADCLALEDALSRQFGLQRCIVAPDLGAPDLGKGGASDAQQIFAAIGSAAARLLHQELACGSIKVVGVGKGRSLAATVDRLPGIRRPDLQIVPFPAASPAASPPIPSISCCAWPAIPGARAISCRFPTLQRT